jgi:hypothetical protein
MRTRHSVSLYVHGPSCFIYSVSYIILSCACDVARCHVSLVHGQWGIAERHKPKAKEQFCTAVSVACLHTKAPRCLNEQCSLFFAKCCLHYNSLKVNTHVAPVSQVRASAMLLLVIIGKLYKI